MYAYLICPTHAAGSSGLDLSGRQVHGGHASVHGQHLARDEGGAAGAHEEGQRAGDLMGLGKPAVLRKAPKVSIHEIMQARDYNGTQALVIQTKLNPLTLALICRTTRHPSTLQSGENVCLMCFLYSRQVTKKSWRI